MMRVHRALRQGWIQTIAARMPPVLTVTRKQRVRLLATVARSVATQHEKQRFAFGSNELNETRRKQQP